MALWFTKGMSWMKLVLSLSSCLSLPPRPFPPFLAFVSLALKWSALVGLVLVSPSYFYINVLSCNHRIYFVCLHNCYVIGFCSWNITWGCFVCIWAVILDMEICLLQHCSLGVPVGLFPRAGIPCYIQPEVWQMVSVQVMPTLVRYLNFALLRYSLVMSVHVKLSWSKALLV